MFEILNEGGVIFMYPLLILLIIIIGLISKGFLQKKANKKTLNLIASISLFAVIWGVLGQVIGLIGAFDALAIEGEVTVAILAAGLKISFLSTAFGCLIFLIGRLGIIVLSLILPPM